MKYLINITIIVSASLAACEAQEKVAPEGEVGQRVGPIVGGVEAQPGEFPWQLSQERFNELHFYSSADPAGRRGFRRIEAGPDHPPYGLFCVAPGHQLGFNDLKAIEIARYLDAIAGKTAEPFNFRAGLRIQTLVETIHRSSREGGWLGIP